MIVAAPVNLKGASRKGSLGSFAFWRRRAPEHQAPDLVAVAWNSRSAPAGAPSRQIYGVGSSCKDPRRTFSVCV